ncbi:hypothetical protein GGX14DRAFT_153684 [Mycena pura]|uniref:Uncharacterized protein n=1 Tax=Mycena pura TaxID=153505 RepID=A0AAD6V7C4_9AGAR|nr:hypothetical protein GGX14DRAFT_153684 [Mycena pura]
MLSHRSRPIPCRRRLLGDASAQLDIRPRRISVLADRAADDDSRGEQPRAVRLHGRPRRCESERADGPPTYAHAPGPRGARHSRSRSRQHRGDGTCRAHAQHGRVLDEPPRLRPLYARARGRRARTRGACEQPVRSGDGTQLPRLLVEGARAGCRV